MPFDIGQRVGDYEIVSMLGVGGMGRVYEAIDPVIGRRVAIKTISSATMADADSALKAAFVAIFGPVADAPPPL